MVKATGFSIQSQVTQKKSAKLAAKSRSILPKNAILLMSQFEKNVAS
jgi:hypothetical protein